MRRLRLRTLSVLDPECQGEWRFVVAEPLLRSGTQEPHSSICDRLTFIRTNVRETMMSSWNEK